MKFQCDRCKTRYSIADERVRGKILKIRCKNCEAVITVREGMDAVASAKHKAAKKRVVKKAPTIDSKPVLRNAFERVMDSTQDDLAESERTVISEAPPQQLEEEWYVSLDGEQFGPFNLQQAKDWVAVRPASDELFCWSEGFGDWLATEKVSHFRHLRSDPKPSAPLPRPASKAPPIPMAAASAPSGAVIPATETTPKPLFAATLEKLEQEENPSLDRLAVEQGAPTNGRSQSTGNDATDDGGEFEFDIGEASRVVKLPMLARALQPNSSDSAPDYLPGMNTGAADSAIGRGTGGHATVGRISGGQAVVVPISQEMPSQPHQVLVPSRKRGWIARHLPLVVGLGALAVVVVIMAAIATSEDDEISGRVNRARASVDGLGESFNPRTIRIIETREVPAKGTARRGGARRGGGKVTNDGAGNGTSPFGKRDDFDLTSKDEDRPLDGDDLLAVYRDNRLGVKLCYERALKKDPLLDVRKVYVSLTVATSGVVTKVLLSSHQESQLGTCLVQRMRRWRFRKSSETFSGRFPLVFRN